MTLPLPLNFLKMRNLQPGISYFRQKCVPPIPYSFKSGGFVFPTPYGGTMHAHLASFLAENCSLASFTNFKPAGLLLPFFKSRI